MGLFRDLVIIQLMPQINLFFVILVCAVIFSLVYTFLNIYHLIRFGIGIYPKLASVVFLAGSMILLLLTISLYYSVNLPASAGWGQVYANISKGPASKLRFSPFFTMFYEPREKSS